MPGGEPLRPLYEHLPADSPVIARLARAIDAAIPIAPAEHLLANDRGRYLSVRYSDGTKSAIRQVVRCEPWSDADAKKSVGGRCLGRWVRANDTWWVEDIGIVESLDLSRWWQDMTEFMVPIGSISIPKTIKTGEPFKITLWSWDDVVNGDSVNLTLISLDGPEVRLGAFPAVDLFQGEVTVPAPPPPPPPPITGGGSGGGGGGGVAPANRSPSFIDGAVTSRSVAENAAAGQYIGAPVVARDPDGDALAYTLSGADPQFFVLHPATGQLRVNVPLDYETKSGYSVVVRVADGRGAGGYIAVTVAVTNVGLEGMVGQYDKDDNGVIDRDEAIAAAIDYFNGVISKEEAIAVIRVYFAG